jgi:hypothetical protein
MKAEGHLGQCFLKGRNGDAANAVPSAVGYNFRLILAWLRRLLCQILVAILATLYPASEQIQASSPSTNESRPSNAAAPLR